MFPTLNGTPLMPNEDILVLIKTINRGCAAWVNGRRLEPGDRIEYHNQVIYIEPDGEFRLTDAQAAELRGLF